MDTHYTKEIAIWQVFDIIHISYIRQLIHLWHDPVNT